MRFKPGQEVICIYDDWYEMAGIGIRYHGIAPKKGQIVTVESYRNDFVLYLVGFNHSLSGSRISFDEMCFEPLMDISELNEILQSQTESV